VTSIPAGRREAARRLGKLLATHDGREQLSQAGSISAIVPAAWEDTVGDVVERIFRNPPPATVAILRKDELVFLIVKPGNRAAATESEQASTRATVGMLYEAVEMSDARRLTFNIDDWHAAEAAPLPIDPDLVVT
jgi:hypothetical protein